LRSLPPPLMERSYLWLLVNNRGRIKPGSYWAGYGRYEKKVPIRDQFGQIGV
jgi:hypothetical protein